MIVQTIRNLVLAGIVLISIVPNCIEYISGFQSLCCRFAYYMKSVTLNDTLLREIVIITITVAILNRLKPHRGYDRIDELLNESKDKLKRINEIIEKWKHKGKSRPAAADCPYPLDDELRQTTPNELHIAIFKGPTQVKQLESGDARDHDSTIYDVSLNSILDNDLDERCAGNKITGVETLGDFTDVLLNPKNHRSLLNL